MSLSTWRGDRSKDLWGPSEWDLMRREPFMSSDLDLMRRDPLDLLRRDPFFATDLDLMRKEFFGRELDRLRDSGWLLLLLAGVNY